MQLFSSSKWLFLISFQTMFCSHMLEFMQIKVQQGQFVGCIEASNNQGNEYDILKRLSLHFPSVCQVYDNTYQRFGKLYGPVFNNCIQFIWLLRTLVPAVVVYSITCLNCCHLLHYLTQRTIVSPTLKDRNANEARIVFIFHLPVAMSFALKTLLSSQLKLLVAWQVQLFSALFQLRRETNDDWVFFLCIYLSRGDIILHLQK